VAEDPLHPGGDAGLVPLTPPGWAGRYIGLPYAERGHDRSGCNCWGLVHLVLKERAGIVVDPHAEVSAVEIERATARAIRVAATEWTEISGAPALFDVALMRGSPLHTGIVIAPGWLLHVWRSPHSIAMRFDNPRIRARIIGFYRHRSLA